jgi:hypothetical protein
MSYFKYLAYAAGTIALGPVGAIAIWGASAASSANDKSREKERKKHFEEGVKAAETNASKKHAQQVQELVEKFQRYYDFDEKLVALYAIGLATANADGKVSQEERNELDAFIGGMLSEHFPAHIRNLVIQLTEKPPTLEQALAFAKNAKLPKQDIDDIIDLIANADDEICEFDKRFIAQWQTISPNYEFV